ncbi:MAG: hypothetical protein VR72_01825 [Clostridiaceae bacterium BRH_c20a]|nr:MAG: hypothetical protein VR72_01825 [Clostridiaceae bacterium BRH_c20a]
MQLMPRLIITYLTNNYGTINLKSGFITVRLVSVGLVAIITSTMAIRLRNQANIARQRGKQDLCPVNHPGFCGRHENCPLQGLFKRDG